MPNDERGCKISRMAVSLAISVPSFWVILGLGLAFFDASLPAAAGLATLASVAVYVMVPVALRAAKPRHQPARDRAPISIQPSENK